MIYQEINTVEKMRPSYKIICFMSIVLTIAFLSNRHLFLKQPVETYPVKRESTDGEQQMRNLQSGSRYGSRDQDSQRYRYRGQGNPSSKYKGVIVNNDKDMTSDTVSHTILNEQGDVKNGTNINSDRNFSITNNKQQNKIIIKTTNKQQQRGINKQYVNNNNITNQSKQDNKILQTFNGQNNVITEAINSVTVKGQNERSMTVSLKQGNNNSKSITPKREINRDVVAMNSQQDRNLEMTKQDSGNLDTVKQQDENENLKSTKIQNKDNSVIHKQGYDDSNEGTDLQSTIYEEISIPDEQMSEIINRHNDRNTGVTNNRYGSVNRQKDTLNNQAGKALQSVNTELKQEPQHKLNVSRDVKLVLSGPQKSISLINESKDILKTCLSEFKNDSDTSQFKTHAMNAFQSRRIPLDRPLEETRNAMCINKYGGKLSAPVEWKYRKVSIVIPFHNEEYSIFLRGLHSIYQRTPDWLIHEVILVDDNSELNNLKKPFENYVKNFPKLKLYRTNRREGLIRARLLGAKMSTGDVLVFLDAHIECQKTWLEPLIDMINNKPSAIAIPTVDFLDPNIITYKSFSRPQYGTFSWELDFVWKDIAWNEKHSDITKPIKSATMIGCAFAITSDTFFSIGSYDEYMNIWGGENLELSFRIWLCSGGLYLSPCSHVGHLFRAYLPYYFPIGDLDIFKNLQRVAETWLGEYKQYYYSTVTKTIALSDNEKQTLSSRIGQLSSLKCKSFDWYLNNIVNGIDIPPVTARLFGQLKNFGNSKCLFYSADKLSFEQCSMLHTNQTFYYDTRGHLIHLRSNKCIGLDRTPNSDRVVMSDCSEASPYQKWLLDPLAAQGAKSKLNGVDTRKPLGVFRLQFGNYQNCLTELNRLKPCSSNNYKQVWIFTHKMKNL